MSARVSIRCGGLAPWKMKRLARHVECNLDRNLETKELAKMASLSVFHFTREFRRSFGVPPHQYVIQERIGRAKRLMIGTNHSITEIAAECGLADQSHLTKLFKQLIGVTPGAWRRTHRKLDTSDSVRVHDYPRRFRWSQSGPSAANEAATGG